ncbi:hypothetical protein EIM44_05100 [Bibersteinia trehalosi]|uniref:Uncharacterized protein n=1 Tax=Bibersteinia trehalosi TaxID=47735 RepID=A0A426FIZ6_BIBTR|nr:hypothetical protein [Bibersteinia trehalosi]RRN04817.1 hypothetical protein EIM44_05100 [Bibersteinia trehalosi]
MKTLILTAINDDDEFYFNHLIPFLLSLKNTNYVGDIGVIAYHLSDIKKQVLLKNNILVFEAENKYNTVYIDRQFTTALIAEKFNYDYIALYDGDIWFPSYSMTLFSEIKENEKLYCCYDLNYGSFIDDCVTDTYKTAIRELIKNYLNTGYKLWQVGLIAGHRQAWLKYQKYICNKLAQQAIFTHKFGIDSLLVVLYSLEIGAIAPLPEKYNSLPTSGNLKYSNITETGQLLEKEIFTVNQEEVQGLHVTGPFRLYERNFYDYISHHGNIYFEQGQNFRLEHPQFKAFIFHTDKKSSHDTILLKVKQIYSEQTINIQTIENNCFISTGSKTHITLANNHSTAINLRFAVQPVLGKRITKGRFIYHRNKTPTIYTLGKWYTINLKPNEECILVSYDIDTSAQITWILDGITLCE